MDRRKFIRSSSLMAAAAAFVPGAAAAAGASGAAFDGATPDGAAVPLKYNSDGTFRIIQFTDTHHIHGDNRAKRALDNVRTILRDEKADLIIHTGDIVYGAPVEAAAKELFGIISGSGIPYAFALGNHDGQFDMNREEVFNLFRSFPGCINPPAVKGISGHSNAVITLQDGSRTDRVFYLFDTGDSVNLQGKKTYDYVHLDQIQWYRAHSAAITKANGGTPVESLAFMHIPVREYTESLANTKRQLVGNFSEEPCPSAFNSGLTLSFREMGDVMAVVSGHDHDDDFVLRCDKMFYIYGRYSGGDTVYNNLGLSGARIFEFRRGKSGFTTYVRLVDGTIEQKVSLLPYQRLRKNPNR